MLTKNSVKINGFYITLILVLLISALLVVFSFRAIFSTLLSITELSVEDSADTKVDVKLLDKAISGYQLRENPRLEALR